MELTANEPARQGHRGWWAIVSPAPTLEASGYLTTPHSAGRVLAGAEKVGPLKLTPAGQQLIDYIRTLQLGWMQFVSWPIVAEGAWTHADWSATERDAGQALHKLCCLLSLLWNEAWQVRVGPQRTDGMSVRPLDDASAPREWRPNDVPHRGLREEEELPDWIHTAWWHDFFDPRKTKRTAALTLWREGKLLQPEHPSFALVAFTASLEQAGRQLVKTGALPKSVRRSAQLFRATVDLVADPSEASLIRNAKVYDLRSAAAHGEWMPGLETLYGPVLTPPFLSKGATDPVSDFVHETVRVLGDVSRAALLRILGGAP